MGPTYSCWSPCDLRALSNVPIVLVSCDLRALSNVPIGFRASAEVRARDERRATVGKSVGVLRVVGDFAEENP